jgi:hypothetical protein
MFVMGKTILKNLLVSFFNKSIVSVLLKYTLACSI